MKIENNKNIDIKGKNIVIIGIGRSGAGAGKLAKFD